MPLARTAKLTDHFLAGELGVDDPTATDQFVENARGVARWLEAARAIVNENRPVDVRERKIIVTSGYRTPSENAAAGGSATTDHDEALAADWKVTGLTPFGVYQRLMDKRTQLPPFDQLIWYAADDHIHLGLGPRMRRQVLLKTTEGSYVRLAGELVSRLRGFV
jgi:peptidase M15-like protein